EEPKIGASRSPGSGTGVLDEGAEPIDEEAVAKRHGVAEIHPVASLLVVAVHREFDLRSQIEVMREFHIERQRQSALDVVCARAGAPGGERDERNEGGRGGAAGVVAPEVEGAADLEVTKAGVALRRYVAVRPDALVGVDDQLQIDVVEDAEAQIRREH